MKSLIQYRSLLLEKGYKLHKKRMDQFFLSIGGSTILLLTLKKRNYKISEEKIGFF